MLPVENYVSSLVEGLFPGFYETDGPDFVTFVKAYYEWLEDNFQVMLMETVDGFSVGDVVTQEQDTGIVAIGTIVSIYDETMLVRLASFAPFRCETNCNVLSDVTNSTGAKSKIVEQSRVNPIYGARNLFKFRDIDSTVDSFIGHFKEKYLKNIQFNTATNKQLLVKNSLDLYRSKGTERSIDLFFKLIYNKEAEVYYPGDDVWKLSDGDWFVPRYLEVSESSLSTSLVGRLVTGMTSGATAFVEKFIRRRSSSGYTNVMFVNSIEGTFERGETLRTSDTISPDMPRVLGSLNGLEIVSAGGGYSVGDIVDVHGDYGQFGQARVTETRSTTGEVDFIFESGGYGYTTSPVKYLSEKTLTVQDPLTTDTTFFRDFDDFSQRLINISFSSITSDEIEVGDVIYSYGASEGSALVLGATLSSVVEVTVDTSTGLTASNIDVTKIRVGDQVVGSANLAVVNTQVVARVTSIVGNAIELDANVAVANGTTTVSFSSVGTVGDLFVYVIDGDLGDTLWTTGNTHHGTVDRLIDKTIYGKVIGHSNRLDLTVSNITGTVLVGDVVTQDDGVDVVSGTVIETTVSGGSGRLIIETTSPFTNQHQVVTDFFSADVVAVTTSIGIQFDREKTLAVSTSMDDRDVLVLSSGNTFGIQVRDQLVASSDQGVVSTAQPSFVLEVVNSTALQMTSDVVQSNGTVDVTFLDITDNDLIVSPNVYCTTVGTNTTFTIQTISLGSGAEYGIVGVETSEEVILNTDRLDGVGTTNVPYMALPLSSLEFFFPKDPSANLDSYLIEALTFDKIQVGSVTDVITTNPGQDYTSAPRVVIVEPQVQALRLRDYVMTVEEVPGTIKIGDVVTQEVAQSTRQVVVVANGSSFIDGELVYQGPDLNGSTATGIVYSANSFTDRLTLVDVTGTWSDLSNVESLVSGNSEDVVFVESPVEDPVIARGIVTSGVVGPEVTTLRVSRRSVPSFVDGVVLTNGSGGTANVVSVTEDVNSIEIGLNALVEADVTTSTGAVASFEIFDSGFGYVDGASITFTGDGSPGSARAVVDGQGHGQGRFRSTNGFLSDDKHLFDANYYQEYSYEIRSSFSFDKYSEIFKKVMHVAGTAVFGRAVLQESGDLDVGSSDFSIESNVIEDTDMLDFSDPKNSMYVPLITGF